MTNSTTVTNPCSEKIHIFRCELAFRNSAKIEPDFRRGAYFGDCAIAFQRERFSHEDQCPVCRAAEAIN